MTEKEPHIEEIFREGLSHSEKVSKKHYRGNLATRLILGYGAPIMASMGQSSKKPCTVVSGAHPDVHRATSNSQQEAASSTTQVESLANNSPDDNNDPTYQPPSISENESDSEIEDSENSALPFSLPRETPVCRRIWSREEDEAIIRRFYKVIKMGCKVSSKQIIAAITEEPSLSCSPARTPVQIRSRLTQKRIQATSTGARLFF